MSMGGLTSVVKLKSLPQQGKKKESYNLEHPSQLVDSSMGLSISSLLVTWPESSQSVVYSR